MNNSHPKMNFTSLFVAACLACVPAAIAVIPPPDGGYANGNTAEGEDALFSLTTGSNNTACGLRALFSATTGGGNTAVGSGALTADIAGFFNVAVGYQTLQSNVGGFSNTAIGYSALTLNTSGIGNTAVGSDALKFNTEGLNNTAIGIGALSGNTTGQENTAAGNGALSDNTTGGDNTAQGLLALSNNTTGSANTAVGALALNQSTSGSGNIAVGNVAGRSLRNGDNNIDIGNAGLARESGVIRLGAEGVQAATYVAGIVSSPLAVLTGVGITTDGRLGVRASSARYKEAIQPMDKSSEAILSLQPVTFRYKKELDPSAMPQFGLVAEQVAKVNPDLVARDDLGQPYTVRYEAVNAMLLNEFLKEHCKVNAQEKEITALKATVAQQSAEQMRAIDALSAIVKAQAEQIQKVSAQMQTKQVAPRLVSIGD